MIEQRVVQLREAAEVVNSKVLREVELINFRSFTKIFKMCIVQYEEES
jgi:hypothetical protein